ncbi:MAG: hypothetical protein JRJ12_01730 [Deltaproteobacteria bacterium]|nr:hypothetical protein [Deltaproteobacteria bacterium]MBW2069912.1 hypothetical protein [Deltaproteobacteria bacterium]
MEDITPQGANVRKAVQWISDKRQYEPEKCGSLTSMIEKAAQKFGLSPKDEEFLFRFFSRKGNK